jgi:hypothetical protein
MAQRGQRNQDPPAAASELDPVRRTAREMFKKGQIAV